MNSLVHCLLWCLFLGFNPILAEGNVDNAYENGEQKIIGGFKVREGALPYQCSYRTKVGQKHQCGGSIISNNHVLTAAHCWMFNEDKNDFEVVAGIVNVYDSANMVVRDIKDLYLHKHFNRSTIENDIALIQVDKPYVFSKRLAPIALNTKPVREGTQCIVSGWGKTKSLWGEGSENLMAAMVPMMGHKQCASLYPGHIDPNSMICAGYKQGKINACNGDSGGPLACNNQLVGVVSWGYRYCAAPNRPAVYADVSKFIPWITAHMALNH